jgi:phosphate transport system permease protein
VLVQGIKSEKHALGFFGLAGYEENRHLVKAVPIDDGDPSNGDGPVLPSADTVADGDLPAALPPGLRRCRRRVDGARELGRPRALPPRRGPSAGARGRLVRVRMGDTPAGTLAWRTLFAVGAAVYLEEYADQGPLSRLIEVDIANLAGVPGIIYGLLGLEVFVRALHPGRSLVAGALTLAQLVLPIVILSTREALRTVPDSLREGARALGATRWQVVRQVVLPMALPGILTGAILSVSRAMGETAPLVVVGALTCMPFLPDGLDAPFTALPIQIFNRVSRPQAGFVVDAAAGITVLLATLFTLNLTAIVLQARLQPRRG